MQKRRHFFFRENLRSKNACEKIYVMYIIVGALRGIYENPITRIKTGMWAIIREPWETMREIRRDGISIGVHSTGMHRHRRQSCGEMETFEAINSTRQWNSRTSHDTARRDAIARDPEPTA